MKKNRRELDESKIDGKKKERGENVHEEEYEKELDESKIDGKKKERGENVDEEEYEKELDESKIDGKKKERERMRMKKNMRVGRE